MPREHGFWVMVGAALFAALLRARFALPAVATAALVLALAALSGGILRRVVRRHSAAQLGSAAALSMAGAPIELLAGVPAERVVATVAAWCVVFVSSALSVRAAMSRARRDGALHARRLDVLSLWLPALGALGFAALGHLHQLAAAGVAFVAALAFAAVQPSVKKMKAIGIALAVVAVVAALLLGAAP